jgi:hypothetical protein
MKCVKQDRYVTHRGPLDRWTAGLVEQRALAAAENEGWPLAAPADDTTISFRHATPEPVAKPGSHDGIRSRTTDA